MRAEDEAAAIEREASNLHNFVGQEITLGIANLPLSDLFRNAEIALSRWTFALSAITRCMRGIQRAKRLGAPPWQLSHNEQEYNCIRLDLDETGIKLQNAAHALFAGSDCTESDADAPSVTVDEELRAKELLNITEGSDALNKFGIDAQIPYACVNSGSYEEVAEALKVSERIVVEQMERFVVFRGILVASTISRSLVRGKTVSEGVEVIKKIDLPELDEDGNERAKLWGARGYLPEVARRMVQVEKAVMDYLGGKYHM